MAAKWEKKEANKGELTFEIAPDKIKEGLDKAFQRTKKNLAVPGFRKGRVPRQIFDQMYGEEALYQDALNIVLPDAYEEAIKETSIEPVDQPQVDVESMDKGKAWVLKAVVTVKPDVKLGDYKGLSVTKQNTRVYQKDIDAELEKQRQQQAELVLKEDQPAANGDTVVIDFDGYVDGKQFDGGKADNYSLELGSNSFIPGFEDQLVGHKAGDDVDVKVTFPKDYQAKDLQDKEATFKVTIHEVKEKQLPELDDEFAKDVDEDVDSLDELKAKTKDRLKEEKTHAAHDAIEDEAISEAVDNAEIGDVPAAMIKDDVDRQVEQYLANMQQQGIQPKMYFQLTGTTEEDLRKQFSDGAEKRVKTNLVLEAVVEAEKIEPTEDQVKAEVKDLAGQYGMEESAVRSALSDDMLKHDIAIKSAVDLIADSAKQDKKKDADND
ncbi:trigger factor [Levilactobacillus zymae]|uniref:Trigger factor n=1 Tax=Levilactobacillus zymae TaxID=267363 RepID=A0ABQ0WVM4_9LACO|nr:trigger factor [Levilactobacillus zymae]KRL15463.1 trigger factor [Levilactobacillus zymae DSM 19395]QFR60867.1 trigger factor [Levilactobacillus zymae]GEO71091.1 trigger factor [Levilactobacillus zymae]